MKTFQYFWKHTKKYKKSFITLIIGILLGNLFLNILIPSFIGQFIDLLSQESKPSLSEIKRILLSVLGLYFLVTVSYRLAGYSNAYFQPSVMRDIEQDCLNQYHKQSLSFFSNTFVGGLVSKTNRLTQGFERIADILYWEILGTILIFVIFSGILLTRFPNIAFIFLGWSVLFITGVVVFSLWKLKYDKKSAEYDSEVNASLADSLTNFGNVKTFAHDTHEKNIFQKISFKRFEIRKFTWTLSEHFFAVQELFMGTLIVSLLYLSSKNFLAGTMSIGDIVLVQIILFELLMRLWDLGHYIKDFAGSYANCQEMITIIHHPIDIQDAKNPQKCTIKDGKIELKNVTFTYEDTNTVFKDFNLEINSGEKVGLVGESGSGKSTLTKILLRFNDIKKGAVLIDGQDITQIKQDDLRKNISYVPQDSILFHRSLMENIQYGDLKATEEEILEAARKAHAHEFIMKTKDQYKTLVGERGIKLSGGERQRISIARAMLKQAPILILDEATSALDSNAEKLIQEALDEIMKDRTTLVIAHRLSTLRKMDRIIVLDKGQIIETGTHEELLKNKGKYAELWNHQVGGFIG